MQKAYSLSWIYNSAVVALLWIYELFHWTPLGDACKLLFHFFPNSDWKRRVKSKSSYSVRIRLNHIFKNHKKLLENYAFRQKRENTDYKKSEFGHFSHSGEFNKNCLFFTVNDHDFWMYDKPILSQCFISTPTGHVKKPQDFRFQI